MSNRLITIEEVAQGFQQTCEEHGISQREAFEVIAYGIACAYDEDEQRQVRKFLGLELPPVKACLGCGSATQPCCGH